MRLTVLRKNGKRTLYVEKVRNGEGGRTLFDYKLKVHEPARDAKDRALTSCTLDKSEPSATGKSDGSQQPKRGPVDTRSRVQRASAHRQMRGRTVAGASGSRRQGQH